MDVRDRAAQRITPVRVECLRVADTIAARVGVDQTGAVDRTGGAAAVYIAPVPDALDEMVPTATMLATSATIIIIEMIFLNFFIKTSVSKSVGVSALIY